MTEKPVNVLINLPLQLFEHRMEDKYKRQISAVSPRVRLEDASDLVFAQQKGDFPSREQLYARLAEAEVIYGFPPPGDLFDRALKLKWVHSPLAGVDAFLVPQVINSPMILTNGRGIHNTAVSELALTLMLMLAKQAKVLLRQQEERQWERFMLPTLKARTTAVLGLGNIGKEIARLAKAFGMRVVAMEERPMDRPEYVDEVLPTKQLGKVLEQSDFVVIALPLTAETIDLIGEAELRAMKPTAYIINIARGGIINEVALGHALREHWIAGAGLDVTAAEPLPPESPLWDLPNLILTPHVAGMRSDFDTPSTELFCENLRRYLNGQELLNVVDKKKGY